MKHPHFDLNLIVWNDSYSGRFPPPPSGYEQQFDLQWRLAMEDPEYRNAPGSATNERYIHDRVFEWTGLHPDGRTDFWDGTGGVRKLDVPISAELIKGKRCLDAGCGSGRWTRVMQYLGAATVVSLDISKHALESTRKFNPQVVQTDIMELSSQHPEFVGQFEFVNSWGVVMCTHDPLRAFLSTAATVGEGGYLYLMVYADGGLHNQPLTNLQRRIFHSLPTIEDRLKFVKHVYHRYWDWRYPIGKNIENVYANLRGFHKGTLVGVLDMLSPYYNWVIPWGTIEGWAAKAGFRQIQRLNAAEKRPCAYHVLLKK